MAGGIFLIQGNGGLVEMREQPYDSEDFLQNLLAHYPNLLAGDQVDPDAPRRWLLVCREAGVPDEADAPDRWSLDHLFLDQDAVPTLVEVKRSDDTRIRREVVGQMLDYAANAVVYWPVETIRARFEARCEKDGEDPASLLDDLLGDDAEPDGFWHQAGLNLKAGRIRMVFVADEIPTELRRVVEFLNGQMDPAEVLAVEIKQFVGEGLRTLVPRVLGHVSPAGRERRNTAAKLVKINEEEFLAEFSRVRPAEELKVAKRLTGWARGLGLGPNYNKNPKSVSFIPVVQVGRLWYVPISLQSKGDLVMQMRWLRRWPPFDDEGKRRELWERLNTVPGFDAPLERMTGYVGIGLAKLADDPVMAGMLEVLNWVVAELRAAGADNATPTGGHSQ